MTARKDKKPIIDRMKEALGVLKGDLDGVDLSVRIPFSGGYVMFDAEEFKQKTGFNAVDVDLRVRHRDASGRFARYNPETNIGRQIVIDVDYGVKDKK